MSSTECLGPFSMLAATALAKNRLVKATTVSATYCAAGDLYPTIVGRTNDAYASGAYAGITPLTRGIMRITAGAAIAAGAAVYPAANGKISSTAASGSVIGYALQAASGDNSEIDVLVTY